MLSLEQIDSLIDIAKEAGESVMEIYSTNFDYQIKKDDSPLTMADISSNDIINHSLKELTPDIPILSEENSDIPYEERYLWEKYWLVDPLDGTKEFIQRNGDFTVNIALIHNNRPVCGVIYVPVTKELYWGTKTNGSHYIDEKGLQTSINVSKKTDGSIRLAMSRSHPSDELNKIMSKIKTKEVITAGSSLKFCLVANGNADCYPRFGPTSEWDTAAGEAIVIFAGGYVCQEDGQQILYNKKNDYINTSFIVANSRELATEILNSKESSL